MKKLLVVLVAVVVIAGLVGGTTIAAGSPGGSDPAPTVVVITPVVELSNDATVTIMGSGYEPGQEVVLIITSLDGVKADIGYALDPAPVANEVGAWATVWTAAGRYVKKKVVKEAIYSITVTDADYNTLATAPFGFYDASKPSEEWPSWAQ